MPTVFADTSFYLAFLRENDPAHSRADAETEISRHVVTTECIILELGNALSKAAMRSDFIALMNVMRKSPRVTVVPLDSVLLERGLRRMASRPDKDWSLTDCISFSVMEDHGIVDAFTADRHFEQAGFRALLRQD